MPQHYVIIDTDVFRHIYDCDFQEKFISLCQKCSILIITIIQVEKQIKKDPQWEQFLNQLISLNLIKKYSTPQNLKEPQTQIYTTLEPLIGETDAELIAVTVLNDYILLTNDKKAIKVFSQEYPELYKEKLKPISFESLLYLAYLKETINDSEGESFLNKYKACFKDISWQPGIIRNKNFIEMMDEMHSKGVSPRKFFG